MPPPPWKVMPSVVSPETWEENHPSEEHLWVATSRRRASARQLRLLSLACCRACWASIPNHRWGPFFTVFEHLADDPTSYRTRKQRELFKIQYDNGLTSYYQWRFFLRLSQDQRSYSARAAQTLYYQTDARRVIVLTRYVLQYARRAMKTADTLEYACPWQLALLRDIITNPFMDAPRVNHAILSSFEEGLIPKLAEDIYAIRDYARLPILADALEESGGVSPDILAHLRGKGPHTRGCWALDLVLGKE